MQIARRYFTPGESQALAILGDNARTAAFLSLWTAKEAVLKALGRGIAFGLNRLDIAYDPPGLSLQHIEDDDALQWQLHALCPHPAYIAAVAWRGGSRRIVWRGSHDSA
jgi:4'-phosphopantetheinyl transferase